MSSTAQCSLPARLVLGRATFHDRTKPDVSVFDVVYRHPDIGLIADGLGVVLAEDFPLALTSKETQLLPGQSLGDAVVRALSREDIAELLESRGQELQDEQIRTLMFPLLSAAYRGDVVIAGVQFPPSPDPQYMPFAPNMLPNWKFVAGRDVAEPHCPGSFMFISVRVFSPQEWIVLDAVGRRLRARNCSGEAIKMPAIPVSGPAHDWMRKNVTRAGQWKRDSAIQQCCQDTRATYRESREAWGALPQDIRGKRGAHK